MKRDTNRVQVSPAKMPASKLSHALSVLRKNLALRQTQLAKMVGCSVATITSVEVGRLKLSESLAKRIAAVTGCDEQWLLAGDASVPMPPKQPVFREVTTGDSVVTRLVQRRDQAHIYTVYLLIEVFSRLFAEVRKLEKTNVRNTLENCIRKELEVLEKTQTAPDALPLHSATKQILQELRKRFGLPAELLNLGIDLDRLIETAPEAKAKSPTKQQKYLKKDKSLDELATELQRRLTLEASPFGYLNYAETSLLGNKRIFPNPAVTRTRRST